MKESLGTGYDGDDLRRGLELPRVIASEAPPSEAISSPARSSQEPFVTPSSISESAQTDAELLKDNFDEGVRKVVNKPIQR